MSTTRDGSHIRHEYWPQICIVKIYSHSFCVTVAGNNSFVLSIEGFIFLVTSKWRRRAISTPNIFFSPDVLQSSYTCVMMMLLNTLGRKQIKLIYLKRYTINVNLRLSGTSDKTLTKTWKQKTLVDVILLWLKFHTCSKSFMLLVVDCQHGISVEINSSRTCWEWLSFWGMASIRILI